MGIASYERRDYGIENFEVRETEQGQKIVGMAVPFNKKSSDLGGFVEQVDARAVDQTLQDSDVVMLWQHDSTDPITRESTGLKLEVREGGLFFEANASDFTDRQLDLMQRGVVKQMSFGFLTIRDEWNQEAQPVERTLLDIDLREISPVTWPAYNQTNVAVRSAEKAGLIIQEKSQPTETKEHDFDTALKKKKLDLLLVDANIDE